MNRLPELTEVGGGINLGPNAVRVLYRLGLGSGLDRDGVRPLVTHQRRWQDGRTLQRAPVNPLCEQLYGAPHLTLHRRDLLAVIASGLPNERIHLGHRLVGISNQGDVVEAWFDNGERASFDVLVGADGIRSTVRAGLFGDEAPVFAGCVAYRGLVPVERIADLGLEFDNQSWVGPGGHLVHYFVSRGRLLEFRRLDRARHLEPRGLDRPRDSRSRARRLCRLASADPPDHRRGGDLLHLGVVRSRPAAALVGWPGDVARRCVPPDVSVHGSGGGAGDRRWCRLGCLPCRRQR